MTGSGEFYTSIVSVPIPATMDPICHRCGQPGKDVGLDEAQKAMHTPPHSVHSGNLEWYTNDGYLLYCPPKGVLESEREKFVVSFKRCNACSLWAKKFGDHATNSNHKWGRFDGLSRIRDEFLRNIKLKCIGNEHSEAKTAKRGSRRKRPLDTEQVAVAQDSEAPSNPPPPPPQPLAPPLLSSPVVPKAPLHPHQVAASGPPQVASHLAQQTTESLSQQSPSTAPVQPQQASWTQEAAIEMAADVSPAEPQRTRDVRGESAAAIGASGHEPEGVAHAESAARQFSLNLKQTLSGCLWTAALLHHFIDKQKETLEFLPTVHKLISEISASKENQGQEIKLKIVKDALDSIEELLLPIAVGGEQLTTVKGVIDFTIKGIMADDRKAVYSWKIFFEHAKAHRTDVFAQKVEDFINVWPPRLIALLPTLSLGIFFRLPSWLARLVLFIFNHNTAVQYRLMDQGYRSFAQLHGRVTPQDPVLLDAGGKEEASGEEEVHYSIICGYNIGECPAWVRDGIAFSGHSITQEHRDIVERLSSEYHQRFEAYQKEGGEEEGEEEGGKEQYQADDDQADDELAPSGTISPKDAGAITRMPPLGHEKGLDSEAVGAAVEGAVTALKEERERAQVGMSERDSLWNKLSSCRQSEREARDLLDEETYNMIFKVSKVKGGERGATRGTCGVPRSTGCTGGGGVSRGGQSEEKIEVERVLNDLHDFRGANGVWTSDWVLQVTVKQHADKNDEDGKRIDASTKGPDFRLYCVDPGLLIRVTVKNLSQTRDISLMPVYVKENGDEEAEERVELKPGECFELPFPLQKEGGEGEDAWALKDDQGNTVLKLCFTL